jgi:hypothetical protein
MCWYEEYNKSAQELALEFVGLDLSIQALIKKSGKAGTLDKNQKEIIDLLANMSATAEWLDEALEAAKQ